MWSIKGLGYVFGWLIAASSAPYAAAQSATAPPASIQQLLQKSNLPLTALGAVVMRVSDQQVVWSHQPEVAMQPASTMKVVTAIVGLEKLGPAYRGRVDLATQAPLADGVLRGDLVLRGFGNADVTWEDFQRMLLRVRDNGIRRIDGNLVVDRNFFRPARIDLGLPPFDEAPEFRYNVIPDALLINTNLAQFDIETDGSIFQIRLTPKLPGVSVISNMAFADHACDKWGTGWKIPTVQKSGDGEIRVYLEGSFPRNCRISTNLNVIDRTDYTERLFRGLWKQLGGEFSGHVIEGAPNAITDANGFRVLAEQRSRPLAEVARNINKDSDNTMTRMVFLTLGTGAAADPSQSTLENADREVRAWLRANNIDDTGFVSDNGSGLSRIARISATQLASVLQAAYRSKWAPELLSSLPIVGVDGSMRNRLKTGPATELARIKTGSLRNVVSVAGYVTNTSGEVHVVVAMINDDRAIAAGGRQILDAILEQTAASTTARK
jgi:serine-type D-Ala-D-Ala carboxypeptidase/endopeptidase (penicillin-binding protein 4)